MSPRQETKRRDSTFRETYVRDRKTGRSRTLGQYLALFPQDQHAVAEEYLTYERDPSSTGAEATIAKHGERISHYVLIRQIGRGGQGRVFLAEDTRFKRRVALKVLDVDPEAAEESLLRFQREAETVSALEHPGICPLYDGGVEGGTAYIVMRHIDGVPLSEVLRKAREDEFECDSEDSEFVSFSGQDAQGIEYVTRDTPARSRPARREIMQRARLIEKAARALHAAHEAGVIHRDVKPGNIMVAANGLPVLLDFGMARRLHDATATVSQRGGLYGTPAYMAPEQLAADDRPIDGRVDLHALAVVLYECITHERPYRGAHREALFHSITSTPPTAPRSLNPEIPVDLESVVLRALEKKPEDRYASALDFADDLRRVRCYEPVEARPAGRLLRLRRWCRRNPVLSASLCLTFVLLFIGLGLTSHLLRLEGQHTQRLSSTLDEVRRERDAKEQALAALEEERKAKEAYLQLAEDLLNKVVEPRAPIAIDGVPVTPKSAAFPAITKGLNRLEATTTGAAMLQRLEGFVEKALSDVDRAATEGLVPVRESRLAAEPIEMRTPRGSILEERPTFTVRLNTIGKGAVPGLLSLVDAKGAQQCMQVVARPDEDGRAEIVLPPEQSLEPGQTYRWAFATDLDGQRELKTQRHIVFRVAGNDEFQNIAHGVACSGDVIVDGLTLANALLEKGFASEAIRHIEALPDDANRAQTVRRIYLLGRAFLMLRDDQRIDALRGLLEP
ncbi:MAG: protein kinase [Planctomycetes bacterium]|nr:protein kinase [Planctomycetota bacterium]